MQESVDTKDLNVQRLVDVEDPTTNMIVEILVYNRAWNIKYLQSLGSN